MKEIFHKTMSIIMALVVLFTTTSFTMDMHYCGDKMVDFSFFHNVETCVMEKAEIASTCENPELSKKSCCTDDQFTVDGQDNLKNNFSKLTFEQQIFVASFVYAYIRLFEGTASNEVHFFDYAPPFVKRDVQVLHQSFLI
jgi:hypothetical protein